MWIKICANTSLADALAAAHLGVDAVGFVFAPSTRQVHAEQVRAMVAGLPLELEKVGVFPALDAAEIAAAARVAGLTGIQLHGGWDAGLTAVLTRLVPEMKLIQTAHWDVDEVHAGAYVEAALKEMPADARVLVDAKVGRSSGGTGRTFEWDAAKGIFAETCGTRDDSGRRPAPGECG